MATIDNLDLNVYRLYAVRAKMVEEINQQYRLQDAASIPPQTAVIDTFPKMTELDILLGIVPRHTPWAFFLPPKRFRRTRRSSFAFSRIVPSLREEEEEEKALNDIETNTPEEAQEKEAIASCFKEIHKINGWLSFIVGRVGQFLQG